jgi:hypothetical protein
MRVCDAVIALSYRHVPELSSTSTRAPHLRPLLLPLEHSFSKSSSDTFRIAFGACCISATNRQLFQKALQPPDCSHKDERRSGKVTGAYRLSASRSYPSSCQPRLRFTASKAPPVFGTDTYRPVQLHSVIWSRSGSLSSSRLRPVTRTTAFAVLSRINHYGSDLQRLPDG